MKFENVTVEIVQNRWNIQIIITHPNGKVEKFRADAGYLSGDAIWFGTEKEHDDWW